MTEHATQTKELTIRRMDLSDADADAVAKLAELDTSRRLEGPVLGAEVEGRLVAAISIDTGAVIADPFSRTSEVRAMLKLRADQLSHRDGGRVRRASHLFGRRSRPAVGGSPPGQLITLPR